MKAQQIPVEFPELQAAIYRVALSVDAFLVNGIQYGVLLHAAPGGLLTKTVGNLLRDLASLEEMVPLAPKTRALFAELGAACQDLIDHVSGLNSFRTMPLQQVRATVSQIPPLRAKCVRLLQEMETSFQTPTPFYQSRSAHSAAAVNDFLAALDGAFVDEWRTSRERGERPYDASPGTPSADNGPGQEHSTVNATTGPRSSG